MFFFGRKKTKFGEWLRRNGISQQWLSEESGVPDSTISKLTLDEDRKPTSRVGRKIIAALKQIDPHVSERDFWSM